MYYIGHAFIEVACKSLYGHIIPRLLNFQVFVVKINVIVSSGSFVMYSVVFNWQFELVKTLVMYNLYRFINQVLEVSLYVLYVYVHKYDCVTTTLC